MAVTAGGTPYVESSDLVANYPGASLALANRVDQVMQAPTQNAQTGTTYTAALLDAGKTVTLSNAAAVTLTIPAQATVAWVDNTRLNFLNIGVGTVTITPAATVTINGTPLTLATSKGGSLVRTASNTWTFTPSGGGSASDSAVVSSTQTSTTTSYADLATPGPSVTLTTGTKALVSISVFLYQSGAGDVEASFEVSGATTVAATSSRAVAVGNAPNTRIRAGSTFLITGLTAGSNTFKMKYFVSSGTGTFSNRSISVVDMGS